MRLNKGAVRLNYDYEVKDALYSDRVDGRRRKRGSEAERRHKLVCSYIKGTILKW